jgi:hypothetical protein
MMEEDSTGDLSGIEPQDHWEGGHIGDVRVMNSSKWCPMCDVRDPNVVEKYRCKTCACALCLKCATVAAQEPYCGECPGCWCAPRLWTE